MNCKEFKVVIDKYIEGIVERNELDELKLHAESCPQCRKQYLFASNIESVLQQSVASDLSAKNASEKILPDLNSTSYTATSTPKFTLYKYAAAAACIFIGFGLAQIVNTADRLRLSCPKVPIKAIEVSGTVLVKHSDTETWRQLSNDTQVCLGDTFHSAGRSKAVLLFEDGSRMALNQNTTLELKEFNGKTDFYLSNGKVHSDLRTGHSPFFISTPHGRAEALGTDFIVSVE